MKIYEKINSTTLPTKFQSDKHLKWALLEYAINRIANEDNLISVTYQYTDDKDGHSPIEKAEFKFAKSQCKLVRSAIGKSEQYFAFWEKRD